MILDEGVGFLSKNELINNIYQFLSPSTEKQKIFQLSFQTSFRKFHLDVSGVSMPTSLTTKDLKH